MPAEIGAVLAFTAGQLSSPAGAWAGELQDCVGHQPNLEVEVEEHQRQVSASQVGIAVVASGACAAGSLSRACGL